MLAEVTFCAGHDSRPISTEQLREKLANKLKASCRTAGSLLLCEAGIVLSLTLDESGKPTSAVAEFSHGATPTHVRNVFKVFRDDLGWLPKD